MKLDEKQGDTPRLWMVNPHWIKRPWVLGFAGAALLQVLLFTMYYQPKTKRLVGDEGYYFNLAKDLAANQPAEHHPFWPPLYAETVGLIFEIFGQHLWIIQSLQVLLLWISAWLLGSLVARSLGSPLWGSVLGCLFLLSPEWAAFAHYVWPEAFHLFFMLLAVWIWVCYPKRWFIALATGVCLGLALLSKLLLLPLVPLCCVMLVLLAGDGRSLMIKRVLMLCLGLVLTLGPTMVANKQRLGEFIIADSSLFNIWVGFNDESSADYRHDIAGEYFHTWTGLSGDWHAKKTAVRERFIDQMNRNGWVNEALDQVPRQYRRLLDPQTFLVTQLPDGPRSAYAGERDGLARGMAAWTYVWHGAILLLAGMGVWMISWRRPSLWWLFGGFLAYNLALFLLVHVKTRFLLQMWPAILPFALAGFLACVNQWKPLFKETPWWLTFSKWRLCGAVLTVLMLALLMYWPR